jgi:hypothetical protein
MSTLYAKYSDIVTAGATWSVTAGANAAAYPLANVFDLKAHTVAKSTGTTITYRATFAGAQALEALAFINTNATAIQVTNGAGLNVAVSIPAIPGDALNLDPWKDLRGIGNTSSTTWNFALTGPSGVALGIPILASTIRTMPLLWAGLTEDEQHLGIIHPTDYGVRLKLGLGVRQRVIRGELIHETFRTSLLALLRDAQGPLRSFLFILDDAQNDALYVDLTDDVTSVSRLNPRASHVNVVFTEQQKGWL